MIPLISFVGKSNSGKTTVIEKLVTELKKRGYRTGVIKHTSHGFKMDLEGKDTWRYRHAGASVTVASSPNQVAVIEDRETELTVEEIRTRFIRNVDIIILEGHKNIDYPRIEVSTASSSRDLVTAKTKNLLAVACDTPLGIDIPQYRRNDIFEIADFIVDKIIRDKR